MGRKIDIKLFLVDKNTTEMRVTKADLTLHDFSQYNRFPSDLECNRWERSWQIFLEK